MAWIVILAVIIGILGYYAYKGYKGYPVGMEGQGVDCTFCSNKFAPTSDKMTIGYLAEVKPHHFTCTDDLKKIAEEIINKTHEAFSGTVQILDTNTIVSPSGSITVIVNAMPASEALAFKIRNFIQTFFDVYE